MLRVEDIPPAEMHKLLMSSSFGHLGCAREGRPYVVPVHYAYDGKELYFYTTEGMKTQFMSGNPQVCLQVEEIIDGSHWRSVMIIGRAERLTNRDEMARAMKQITDRNPSLGLAISRAQVDVSSSNSIALYIHPEIIDGRKTM
jgi:uncharacterized protein